jgi:hypothetical protein
MNTRAFLLVSCLPILVCITRAGSPELGKLLPDIETVTAESEPQVFTGEDLWDYINGGAEPYHDYGFVKVIAQKYKWAGVKGTFSVDIYDMGKLAHAFGIFSSFRLAGTETPAVGTECQFNGAALDFYHGQYYVQIGGPQSSPNLKDQLVALGKATAGKINAPAAPPMELDQLLAKDRIAGTEKYTRHNLLGYDFLKEAWGAEYKAGKAKAKLWVLLYLDKNAASQAYDKYLQENKSAEKGSIPGAERSFFNNDKYAGLVGACLKGDKVVIITNAPDKKEAQGLLGRQVSLLTAR